ncbi:DUF1653 domain-containing protein [Alkalihalobacillus trypoxylicola]|uniref:DUF1653 domain-containing protein n=1 Tax=Alkalihalobacillus trypoxylicola TaxID=519424 RepID=A0A162E730_9BACI|nr:DUF1653 domain-containing protein [Alkalihalobacillus trypoxylicola]KYG31930.1 hypothetical protein AZF04_03910 [Alkalihalobacillus trypoxylicola]
MKTYKNYKGRINKLNGIAKHSEPEEEMAVDEDLNGQMWVRPRSMFKKNLVSSEKFDAKG